MNAFFFGVRTSPRSGRDFFKIAKLQFKNCFLRVGVVEARLLELLSRETPRNDVACEIPENQGKSVERIVEPFGRKHCYSNKRRALNKVIPFWTNVSPDLVFENGGKLDV